jgi:DNA-binding response OmpR family regulator
MGAQHSSRDADLRVLFVEDDPAIAAMYRLKLEADGYVVTVAADGETGVRLATTTRPDLIFLDIRLPKLDGLMVLERLRACESTSSIPVVILSNYSEDDLVKRGLSMGAMEYLVKAEVTPTNVAARIPSWTGTPS